MVLAMKALSILLLVALANQFASAFYTCKAPDDTFFGQHKYVWVGHNPMATMTEIAAAGGKPGKAAAFDAELEYVKKIRGPPEKAEPAFSEAYVARRDRYAKTVDKNENSHVGCRGLQMADKPDEGCPVLGLSFKKEGTAFKGFTLVGKSKLSRGSVQQDSSIGHCTEAFQFPITDECAEALITYLIPTYHGKTFGTAMCKLDNSGSLLRADSIHTHCMSVGEWKDGDVHTILSRLHTKEACSYGFAEDLKKLTCYALNRYEGCRDTRLTDQDKLLNLAKNTVKKESVPQDFLWTECKAKDCPSRKWPARAESDYTSEEKVKYRQDVANTVAEDMSRLRIFSGVKDAKNEFLWQTLHHTKLCMRQSLGSKRLRSAVNAVARAVTNFVPFGSTIKKVIQIILALDKGNYKRALVITADAAVHFMVDASGAGVFKTVVAFAAKGEDLGSALGKVDKSVVAIDSLSVTNIQPCMACMLAGGYYGEPNALFRKELAWARAADGRKPNELRICGVTFKEAPNDPVKARENLATAFLQQINPFFENIMKYKAAVQNILELDFFSAMLDAHEAGTWSKMKKEVVEKAGKAAEEDFTEVLKAQEEKGPVAVAIEFLGMKSEGLVPGGFNIGADEFMKKYGRTGAGTADGPEAWLAKNVIGFTSDDMSEITAAAAEGSRHLAEFSHELGTKVKQAVDGVVKQAAAAVKKATT